MRRCARAQLVAFAASLAFAGCASGSEPPIGEELLVTRDEFAELSYPWAHAVAFSAWARGHGAPRLEAFAVDTSFVQRNVILDQTSHPMARRYRTVLQDALDAGPNFADSLVVAAIGCGSPCLWVAVLDGRSGRLLYWSTDNWSTAPVSVRWSRLLAEDNVAFAGGLFHGMPFSQVRYLEWTGSGLREVFSFDADSVAFGSW
jgi:hypothetical protein